ncbi:hypothetical protein LCGC14_0067560 [marine sediment metagenome]|uniref:Uncharacterized protein n=1 Tax=marine sediment metagenome TaxID=412755 RepID=A0A0F9Y3F3_9ZZZZ|nr:hypothetical protein [Maribacter sp.]HDZ05540.1 hypothetical protein [Maribacter sp.]HEA81658.1 hypothetical protein [Maribacter sp.]
MRTIIFLFLVVCLGTQSQAQAKLPVSKVQTIVMPMADITIKSDVNSQGFQTAARFFKVKNARVKQALLFKPRVRTLFFA